MYKNAVKNLSREELLTLLEMDSKNFLAIDGTWFQSVEKKDGMDEAIYHDYEAWKRFTVSEAKRLIQFLNLPENPGLDGLEKALPFRINNRNNKCEIIREENRLIYRVVDCRVQTARSRKGMPYHPCKCVGEIEHENFAKTIDGRISCRCISCFPDVTDETCACSWEFIIND